MSFLGRSEYDRDVNTWSPEGRLFQLEYAVKAMELGSTSLGIVCKDGVLLAVEKRITSPLLVPSTVEKIFEIDHHLGCAMSGLTADARTLVDFARNEAQNHWFTYDENISVESVVTTIADMALDFSDVRDGERKRMMSRPFGVALLVGGVDPDGKPSLFVTDPTGTFVKYTAFAIGSAQESARSSLTEQYKPEMTIAEGEVMMLSILKTVMEEKMTATNVEMARIPCDTQQYYQYSTADLESIITRIPATALPTL